MASIEHRLNTHRVIWRENGAKKYETFPTAAAAESFRQLVEGSGNKLPHGWTLGHGFTAPPADEATEPATAPLFRDWATLSLSSRTAANDRTRSDYLRDLTRNAFPHIGDIPLDSITRPHIAAWVVALRQSGLAEKTLRNLHGLVASLMTEAVSEGLAPRSPMPGTLGKSAGVKVEHMEFLTPSEYRMLLTHVSEHYRPLVTVLAGTGMRWSEATALPCGAVDVFNRKTITINRAWKRDPAGLFYLGEPKTRRSRRTLTIDAEVVDAVIPLIAARGFDEYLFTTKAGESRAVRHSNFYNRVWLPAVSSARAQGLTKQPRIHDLRHSHVSWLIAANVPLPAISRRLGHASIVTTIDRYGHLMPDLDDEINAAVSRALASR